MVFPSPRPRRAVRRASAATAAVVVTSALLLGACGSDGGGSTTESSSPETTAPAETTTTVVNTTSLDQVTVSGAVGEKPTVTFTPSFVGTADATKVVAEGDGPVVGADQRVTVDYFGFSGASGAELGGTYGSTPSKFFMADPTLRPIIVQALVGQKVGGRVLVAVDDTQGSGEWNLVVFDIKAADTVPTSAQGEPVTPDPALPVVTVDDKGVPTIAQPQGDPPTSLVVQPLIKGSGPEVTAGQTITVHYVGMIWQSGKVFDSSWSRQSPADFPIGQGQVIAGFDEGLVGQTVGSRVLLVIPPDKGYGDQGNPQAGIGGSDTLVFVVDILAAS